MLVVSASMGAGHCRAAEELRARLVTRGCEVEVVDLLALPAHGQGRRLRWVYALLLRHLPWVYDLSLRAWARWPRALERLTAAGGSGYRRGLLAAVERTRPDVVLSTYNLASQSLGLLVRSGRLDVPVVTYVTDPGAHPYWLDEGVCRHLAVTQDTARALDALGAGDVVWTGPLLGPAFRRPAAPDRAGLGLPADRRIVLVSGGSWGAGEVERTVRLLARDPHVLPVTLCGRDEGLRTRLERAGLGHALGWTDEVPRLLAAADVLVDNAGGLTCLEALALDVPVVLFAVLPGHGRINATALSGSGLARWVRREEDLLPAVRQASATGTAHALRGAVDPVEALLAVTRGPACEQEAVHGEL